MKKSRAYVHAESNRKEDNYTEERTKKKDVRRKMQPEIRSEGHVLLASLGHASLFGGFLNWGWRLGRHVAGMVLFAMISVAGEIVLSLIRL